MFAQAGSADAAEQMYDDVISGEGAVCLIWHQIHTYTAQTVPNTNLLSQAASCFPADYVAVN